MAIPDLTTALAERYRVTGPLGAGGMATVYRADDLRHGRVVAIKVLRPELGVGLGADRFLQEIRTTAGLQHPHILPLLDSGEAAGQVYYVMPLVEGETLRGRLARERQLPVAESIRLLKEIADALQYAHEQGVIHRDIKPENVLLSRGHALVADFGIARAAKTAGGEQLTQTGMSLGTPAYMSPEQVAGDRELDHRADQYSLACVGYELLAGHPPFTGSSGAAVMARHVVDPVPSLATVRPDVPRGMAAALERALGKSPAARFETMAAFAAALDQTEAPSDELSIVVLPFTNLSPDPDNAYFADGLTDEVIADLSKVRSLRVIARNSALQLRGTTKDSATIARELKVRYVLEGSVRRAGNALRITAQLVDGRSNSQLWADKYGGTMDDVFELQEERGAAGFPDEDRAAIERVADSQEVLFNAGKFDEAVAFAFAEDAVTLPPNAPAVVGRPAIQAYMKTFPPFRDFSMTRQMIDGRGDLAVVHGRYEMTVAVPGSPDGVKDVGKYLEVWRKQPDGAWKLIRDAFSSDLPAAGPVVE